MRRKQTHECKGEVKKKERFFSLNTIKTKQKIIKLDRDKRYNCTRLNKKNSLFEEEQQQKPSLRQS